MGKIYVVLGKSASGKDTIYRLLRKRHPEIEPVVLYTTRPIRDGEIDGSTYHFISNSQMISMNRNGEFIESRTYNVKDNQKWIYATRNDFDPNKDYITINTIIGFAKLTQTLKNMTIVPIYIYCSDLDRITRAIMREKEEKNPNISEICRRFLSDEKDFDETHLRIAGIDSDHRFNNSLSVDETIDNIEIRIFLPESEK